MNKTTQPGRPLSRARRILFGILPTALLLAVLVGVEIVMTASGRGIDARPFAVVPGAPDLMRDNLDFPFKYHPVSRPSRQDLYRNLFTAAKPAGSLRGVVLGGSTAEGFPYYGAHGFGGFLQEALTAVSGRGVEVLNLGFSAMSSYYVRDAARKLTDLDLDFVVIYTGHNEYYGTISYSSGAGHLAKLVNMRLKDRRLFQALYNLLARHGEEGGPTLMSRQYSQTRFPPDAERDRRVNDRCVENLLKAVEVLTERGIQVVVVEPVSNLIDMPPFVARDDPGLDVAFVERARAVVSGRADAAGMWLSDPQSAGREAADPLAAYAGARARMSGGEIDLTAFTRAKDLDPAPFRARTGLVEALRVAVRADARAAWVPLAEHLLARLGPEALSDDLFIDHLHFNHRGQVLTAEAVALALSRAWPAAAIDAARLESWFADPDAVDHSVDFLRIFDVLASQRVAALVAGPPYADMALPYRSPGSAAGLDAGALSDPGLRRRLAQVPEGDVLMVYSEHLMQLGDREAFLRFLNAFRRINPGAATSHLGAGHYLATLGNPAADTAALQAYDLACRLAEDPQRQAASIRSYLTGQGRTDLARQIPVQ